jgi:hypothetical protein
MATVKRICGKVPKVPKSRARFLRSNYQKKLYDGSCEDEYKDPTIKL